MIEERGSPLKHGELPPQSSETADTSNHTSGSKCSESDFSDPAKRVLCPGKKNKLVALEREYREFDPVGAEELKGFLHNPEELLKAIEDIQKRFEDEDKKCSTIMRSSP